MTEQDKNSNQDAESSGQNLSPAESDDAPTIHYTDSTKNSEAGAALRGNSVLKSVQDLLRDQSGSSSLSDALSVPSDDQTGKYIVEREIGRGGMGQVYLAFDRDLRRSIAVKVLQDKFLKDPDKLTRFLEEAQITGQLEHPGIPPIHELSVSDDQQVFFTMKLLKGRTLKEILRDLHIGGRDIKKKYSRARLLQILLGVCHAIHFAHEKGVIHRDIKPDNIMLGDYGEVQLMDWGLAKVISSSGEYTQEEIDEVEQVETVRSEGHLDTIDNTIQGTLLYMAPEQARGGAVDLRADIYALGATLYEILTFQPIRSGDSVEDLLEEARMGLVTPPRDRAPRLKIPEALDEICMNALEYHPDDRYESALEMAEAIQVYLDGTAEERRRRAEAGQLFEEARGVLRELHEERQEELRLKEQNHQLEEEAGDFPSREHKSRLRELRTLIEEASLQAARLYTRAQTLLSSAIANDADHGPARRALGELYLERFHQAEKERNPSDAIFYQGLIEQINDGSFDRILRGHGSLLLKSEPSGATFKLSLLGESEGVFVPKDVVKSSEGQLEALDLPMGSYLVEIQKEGYLKTNYPTEITRNAKVESTVQLLPEGVLPEGFVHIPEGEFIQFGDPNVISTFSATNTVIVPDFAINVYPITCGEYLNFLNDLHGDNPEEAKLRSPRQSHESGFWWESSEEGFKIPPSDSSYPWSANLPVFGISFEDAQSYARWWSQKMGGVFDLPQEEEWEKAAKGVDGRFFSWGNHFDNEYANNFHARQGRIGVVEIDEYPIDRSPYGVHGMVGNVADWCYFSGRPPEETVAVRGGNWAISGDPCRLATRRSTTHTYVSDRIGFRLVYRLEDQKKSKS